MRGEALILFSGGIDSTTALYWAKRKFDRTTAVIFSYGQKHRIEVDFALRIAKTIGAPTISIAIPLDEILTSALLDPDLDIPISLATAKNKTGVPLTYVPFRNGIFLAIAAALAESRGSRHLVTGFNCIDTPDYPDTTRRFTRNMQQAINSGTSAVLTGRKIRIHTPLIGMTKSEIIRFGLDLNVDFSYSISCYRGKEIPCHRCPSCDIRQNAFVQLGVADPLEERIKKEKEK